jgi:predicted  nucleic acid-binding Zn-ribbon protein
MSTAVKGTTLRLIMPKDYSKKVVATLGPTAKFESSDTILSAGRLTTDKLVGYIKEYSRLRDELFHTIRQLGLSRNARTASSQPGDYAIFLGNAREELDQRKSGYQEVQSRVESLEKQIDEAKKKVSRINEIIQAGFSSADMAFGKGEFNRALGRIPARKIADAQRALQKSLGDQAVLATGNRVKDSVYVLLAAPEEKMQQATQTLLLYDFTPSETTKADEPDLNTAKTALEGRIIAMSSELAQAKTEMKQFQEKAGESLNSLADRVQDSLMQMQAVLKLGEGAQASKAFAWLTKPPSPRTLSSLSSQGVLYETE